MSADGISQAGPDGGWPLDGGAAQQALERRYQRLLRCYPPRHREFHRAEMLGVLLAAAQPGQDAPGARQTVNLAVCGLAIRARRALSWLAGPWPDALAVVSLIAPVLLVIIAALDIAVTVRDAIANDQGVLAASFWQVSAWPLIGGPAAVLIGWLAVVLLGLTGRRRAAAVVASIPLALGLLALLAQILELSGTWSGGPPLFLVSAGLVAPVGLASLAACSLACSAGPRRGLAIVGRRRACLMVVGLAAAFGFPAIADLLSLDASLAAFPFALLGVLAIVVAVAVTRIRAMMDWRVPVLVVITLVLNLANTFPLKLIIAFLPMGEVPVTALIAVRLGTLLLAVLVWPVAIVSARGQAGQASRAG